MTTAEYIQSVNSRFAIDYDLGEKTFDPNISKFRNFGNVDPLDRVYICSKKYSNSPHEVAWDFYIGGYQPAQKWLKDRKGRILDFEDITHIFQIYKLK